MDTDFGIIISSPGNSVVGAQGANVTFNTNNPFIKIDTQNDQGFQTITMIIVTDPTEPAVGGIPNYTQLYKFAHGYTYVPSLESLFYVSTPPVFPYNGATQTYFQDKGIVGGSTVGTYASMFAIVDKTYVYIYCSKIVTTGGSTLLTGTNVQITTHVFVDDIGAP